MAAENGNTGAMYNLGLLYEDNEENIIEEKEVKINRVLNDKIEITGGLDNIENILLSTRGVELGEKVEVKK